MRPSSTYFMMHNGRMPRQEEQCERPETLSPGYAGRGCWRPGSTPFWAIPRRAILAGYYDGGSKVRDHLNTDEGREWAASRGLTEE